VEKTVFDADPLEVIGADKEKVTRSVTAVMHYVSHPGPSRIVKTWRLSRIGAPERLRCSVLHTLGCFYFSS
jgi:hypothetical protein